MTPEQGETLLSDGERIPVDFLTHGELAPLAQLLDLALETILAGLAMEGDRVHRLGDCSGEETCALCWVESKAEEGRASWPRWAVREAHKGGLAP